MDWMAFLNDNAIEYVTRGPNTARDHVSVKCPWCGDEDPSQHLGISLTSENWGCLRNTRHRGHSPTHLISGILGCSSQQARLIVSQYSSPDPDALDLAPPVEPTPAPEELPAFRPIKAEGSTAKYHRYLERRGFRDVGNVISQYRLKCCLTGRFKDRLMFTFYQQGALMAWSGRAIIDPKNAARYLSSKLVKSTVFNEDQLLSQGGKTLSVVEGPFDAMKLDYYGQEHGVRATCGFGINLSIEQVVILNNLCRRFERVIVLFDQGTMEQAFEAMDWLQAANVSLGTLPAQFKDPGEMEPADITTFIQQIQSV
jgi:hypothetical protein